MTRRPHKVEDEDLWHDVARTIAPFKKRAVRITSKAAPLVVAAAKPVAKAPPAKRVKAPVMMPPHPAPVAMRKPSGPPPLTGLDRRTGQKMTRGKVEIESRIDLHGTGVEEARHRLLGFIRAERAQGARTVLVITGKGESPFARHTLHGATHFHSPERAGRLRRLLPEWLNEHEFRAHVAGFQPAHPKHGGGGAFYVQLRRVRAP
jgi:DNA-nicking Smr family endonuclease